ncbi:hypothetical protein FDB55_09040 [Clostridium botulinum]|uniref:Uncharacterized protein n=1 Tax=Clostridium botulinum TaxID=1491 RepID=A0A0L9Y9T0_CLOBO|nr:MULTISPECIES: hypothetical protein [Clostridium]KAI3349490.1 hypothetical protein CIT18_07780 [Clostridium botulinum]KOM88607.1 hypothetical protein ACP51_05075 [Clostridium botulinum]KOR57444.1 hypothetical protein ADT22_11765 [Clostridium botulinum]MBN1035637.1 hypothetical protein [Clostridium botulinum]MBN1038816.1 hypothetical protein [Clostridium botulinum]
MKWSEVRVLYKDTWILFEALKSHSENGNRIVEDLSVINYYSDGKTALREYAERHKKDKTREMYVYHTKHENLNIEERAWIGVRRNG